MLKKFWDKYKVLVIGASVAIIQAVVGLNQPDTAVQWTAIGMAAVTGLSAWAANNLRGQIMSILGILLSSSTYILQTVMAHNKIDGQHLMFIVLEQLGILLAGYNAPPFKNVSYETNKTIVAAKEVPPLASTQVSEAKKEETSK